MTAISADYRTVRHVPSRKCYQLVMEVAEEEFPGICQTLGCPKTGESVYVGIALLDADVLKGANSPQLEEAEGEKLRIKAVMLCKDALFQEWVVLFFADKWFDEDEQGARQAILYNCGIKSRAELTTNSEAQEKFKQLLDQFAAWKLENQYKDNLERI